MEAVAAAFLRPATAPNGGVFRARSTTTITGAPGSMAPAAAEGSERNTVEAPTDLTAVSIFVLQNGSSTRAMTLRFIGASSGRTWEWPRTLLFRTAGTLQV